MIGLVVLALGVAGCRADHRNDAVPDPVVTIQGPRVSSNPGTTLVPPTPTDPPELEAPTLAGFSLPCGVDADPTPAFGPGIDIDAIRIATGSDEGGRFAGRSGATMPDAVLAMAEHCNTLGGLAGRFIAVENFDAAVTDVPDVALRQCEESFALVGFGYLQESLGIETWNGCGLPRFEGWPAALLDVEPRPLVAHRWVVLTDQMAQVVAIVVPDTTAGRAEAEAAQVALFSAGFTVATVEFYSPVVDVDWMAMGERILESGAGLVHLSGSCRGATMALTAALGRDGPTIVTDVSSYDDGCRADAVAQGVPVEKVLLQLPFLPVQDGRKASVTGAFVEILESYGAAPTGDALLAGAAFWAFAAAIDACRTGEVTQPCVEERSIDAWNGAGLHPSGDNVGCRVVVGLDDKGFRRVFPLEPGRFSCPDDL